MKPCYGLIFGGESYFNIFFYCVCATQFPLESIECWTNASVKALIVIIINVVSLIFKLSVGTYQYLLYKKCHVPNMCRVPILINRVGKHFVNTTAKKTPSLDNYLAALGKGLDFFGFHGPTADEASLNSILCQLE